MSSSHAHVGYNLGAIAAVVAIAGLALAAFGKPHWFVAALLVSWLSLWFLAAVLLSDAEKRPFLAGTLRHSKYTQIYTRLTRGSVLWIWNRLCDPADDKASWPTLFRAALTARLYDRALLLAVAYPILLIVGQWVVTGAQGKVGSFVLLPETGFWPARAALVAAFLVLAAGKVGRNLVLTSSRLVWRRRFGWLSRLALIAFAGLVAFEVVNIVAGKGTFSGALADVGAGGFAALGVTSIIVAGILVGNSVVIAVAVAGLSIALIASISFIKEGATFAPFAVAIILVGLGAFTLDFFGERSRLAFARMLLTCILLAAPLSAALTANWSTVPDDRRSVFLFLAVLPALNGLFDVISYALTLSLIRRGLRSSLPLLWGLADLALACLLFLGLGAVLVVAVHGLNLLAGVPFVDLSALFAGIHVAPGAYVWLYLMLFSTVLPTALHGLVSLIGLQGLCPRPLRRWLARRVDAAPQSPLHAIAASLGLGLLWTGPVMLLVFVGWVAWHYGKGIVLAGLEQYFHLLLWLAAIPIGAV